MSSAKGKTPLKSDKTSKAKVKEETPFNLSKMSKAEVKKVFNIFDYNGNGILSLAEIDRAVIELYPQLSKDKPAIMRAYKAADTSQDGFIDLSEFGQLIDLLFYYDDLYQTFKKLDKNNDKRVSYPEFKKGYELLGITKRSDDDLRKVFKEIDTNDGGYILFDEFCIYAAKQKAKHEDESENAEE